MTKLFLASRFDKTKPVTALASMLLGEQPVTGSALFLAQSDQAAIALAKLVTDIAEADYILIPQAVTELTPAIRQYLTEVKIQAKEVGKKVVVMVGGDLSHNIFIDDMIVLKGSQYGYLKRSNEIIVPPLVADLGEAPARPKGGRAVVGFCGWAAPAGLAGWLKYGVKNFFTRPVVLKKGLYFRRRAIEALQSSSLIKTNFIIRHSFSGNTKTAQGEPAKLRQEYVANIINSDFTLAPKGDGNFSLRFYETLSAGRIPILIDTDCVLPLEGEINYDEVIIRVPYQNINQIAEIVNNWYQNLSAEEWLDKQQQARKLFVEKLRYDAFFNLLFSRPLEDWLPSRTLAQE